MLSPVILVPAILNGLLTGAVYGLIALGLTLIYGVLHIINFAHGALLTAAMFAAFFAHRLLGLDPYLAAVVLNFLHVALLIALVGQGWNVLGGYGGQYSFGHAAFFGTGAYVSAILQMRYGVNAWIAFAP